VKVDKKRFDEAVEYLRLIDNAQLEDLDLSEFGVKGDEIKKDVAELKETGVKNTTIILDWECFRLIQEVDSEL
jgi:hypothetical protein